MKGGKKERREKGKLQRDGQREKRGRERKEKWRKGKGTCPMSKERRKD